jgi:hypothetical protein
VLVSASTLGLKSTASRKVTNSSTSQTAPVDSGTYEVYLQANWQKRVSRRDCIIGFGQGTELDKPTHLTLTGTAGCLGDVEPCHGDAVARRYRHTLSGKHGLTRPGSHQ